MPMVSARKVVKTVEGFLKRLRPGYEIELLSYKKDRSVTIKKLETGRFLLIERGFENSEREVGGEEVIHELKKAISVEFPRSHWIRISTRRSK
ncbi:hypothetical protein E3E26_07765 [Thermococcus sp. LS1]|uniref:hypothetical protein n=1 Tax=Thermococcus sp. LS1 TaxID=1638259 RepID=UPI001439E1FA|nr:hypothetical protein [Thermococcus sp. LS1]NJD99676.1 hypothetical protein [Thermococcus sp. LS1]